MYRNSSSQFCMTRRADCRPGRMVAGVGMALDGEAGNEPGGADAAVFQQAEDAAGAGEPELSARQRRRRGHPARNEAGLRVEVEGEADDVTRHVSLPGYNSNAGEV